MAKPSFLAILFLAAAYSFATDFPFMDIRFGSPDSRRIYIEGVAEQEGHRTFFLDSFKAEAYSLGLHVTGYREEAEFTFRFYVQSHADEYDPSISYIILVSLLDNETGAEMVSFGWPFAELEEMREHNPFVFYMAAALIPGAIPEEFRIVMQVPERDERWRNQWLYVRASIDYPIVFYVLRSTGLVAGQGAYGPGNQLQHLDHIIMPKPGITVGAEWLFHRNASLELNLQGTLGDPRTYMFFNLALGAQVKYIFRPGNFKIQPYFALSVPLNISPEFSDFPRLAIGGGAQVSVRGSSRGAFFLDVNFMYSLGDVFRHNPYGDLTPNPPRIHYRRFVVGLGIGHKFGVMERR